MKLQRDQERKQKEASGAEIVQEDKGMGLEGEIKRDAQEEQLRQALRRLRRWAGALCRCAGKDQAFCDSFWKSLCDSPGMLQEFAYYYDKQEFLCRKKVEGYTIVDIMVWQVDHFKAYMDRREEQLRYNADEMLLMAFDTMLRMEQEPGPYRKKLQEETGTDYQDKYR